MKRDAMRMLMDARPDDLDPNAPVDPATRERELARARHGAHGGTTVTAPARRRVRPVWGIGVAGVAAAAVAAAVLVPMSGGGGGAPAAAKHDGTRRLDGRTVLLTAAESADRDTGGSPSSGAYWHATTVYRTYMRIESGTGAYNLVNLDRSETWVPNSPTGLQVSRSQALGARPVTDADKALWRKAGSPTSWTYKIRFKGGKAKPLPVSVNPGRVETTRHRLQKGAVYWLGRNVTMKQLKELPTDPKALKADLLRFYQGHGTEAEGQKSTADEWLFDVTRGLLTDMPVSPKVRAAAFRMLAELPGVKSLGKFDDEQGRHGVAIGYTRSTEHRGVQQTRLIIDPSQGRGLGWEEALAERNEDVFPGVSAGSVLTSSVNTLSEWTNSAPR